MHIIDVLRIVVGALLVIASLLKFAEGSGAFSRQIRSFKAVPDRLALPIALLLPCVELVIGVMVIGNFHGPWKLAAIALLLGYTALIAQALLRGLPSDCGCFGKLSSREANPRLILRNAAFIAAISPSVITEPLGRAHWGLGASISVTMAAILSIAILAYSQRRNMTGQPSSPGKDGSDYHEHIHA